MKKILVILLMACQGSAMVVARDVPQCGLPGIQSFDVHPDHDAATNKANLQKAIDWAADHGGALFVEPVDKPYPIQGGVILKKNVSLIGVHGPVPRGTKHPEYDHPVGSVFEITDQKNVFLTVESSTQIKGIQFWYPDQTIDDPEAIIPYPATIQVSKTHKTEGVTLMNLTFYGEYLAMDFNAEKSYSCELILIQHCYGYPLGGEFIRIDFCYDIPRILNCHVNPAVQRQIKGQIKRAVVDAVVARKKFAYSINHTDNAQMIDIFTFGSYGGIFLGPETYGQLTNFNLDCVTIGIHKSGTSTKNRNWMIAQGSIIANVGEKLEDIHPFLIEGQGHTAISNVEAFSGGNNALSNLGRSWDFMTVRGDEKCTISMFGCRMRNYASHNPLTILNGKALIQAVACLDNHEMPFNKTIGN